MSKNLNRREFFKAAASLAGVTLVAPTVLNTVFGSKAAAEERRRKAGPAESGGSAAGAMPMVDPNDSVAKAVKYTEDHTKAADSKGNKCATCGFYAKKEDRNGKEVGTCTIFAGKLVVGNGWCASWNKKA
ncbi:MAG: high-potential iron-sulfur protein [Bdellovibrionales bacterium]|nr:high-potential iron-sulfur protein [Bdellovibrionales bacterium]